MFTLAKFIAIILATVTSDTHHCSCLGHLGWCDTDRIVSISCYAAQGGQGKYCCATRGDCRMLMSLTASLTNVANVNDPLLFFEGAQLKIRCSLTPHQPPNQRHQNCWEKRWRRGLIRCQRYKTFFHSSLTMRPNKLEGLPLKTFFSQVLEFEGKARANPIGAPFRCFLLG